MKKFYSTFKPIPKALRKTLARFTSRLSLGIILGMFLLFCSLQAHAERYVLPKNGDSIIGQMTVITAKESDTFIELARRFGLGFQELVLANPCLLYTSDAADE